MLKKLIAAAMAGAMALALAIPSFAATSTTPKVDEQAATEKDGAASWTLNVAGAFAAPNMKIYFDKGAYVILNPYKLTYKTFGDLKGLLADNDIRSADAYTADASSDTVVGSVTHIVSLSDSKVKVDVSAAKLSTSSKISPATAPISNPTKSAAKSIFAYLDFQSSDGTFKAYNKSNKFQLALTEAGATQADMVTIGAFNKYLLQETVNSSARVLSSDKYYSSDASNGYYNSSEAIFRIAGNCVTNPTTPWTSNDKPVISMTFTFSPA